MKVMDIFPLSNLWLSIISDHLYNELFFPIFLKQRYLTLCVVPYFVAVMRTITDLFYCVFNWIYL